MSARPEVIIRDGQICPVVFVGPRIHTHDLGHHWQRLAIENHRDGSRSVHVTCGGCHERRTYPAGVVIEDQGRGLPGSRVSRRAAFRAARESGLILDGCRPYVDGDPSTFAHEP